MHLIDLGCTETALTTEIAEIYDDSQPCLFSVSPVTHHPDGPIAVVLGFRDRSQALCMARGHILSPLRAALGYGFCLQGPSCETGLKFTG